MGYTIEKSDPILYTQGVYNGKLYTLRASGDTDVDGDAYIYVENLIPDVHYKFNEIGSLSYLGKEVNYVNDCGKYDTLLSVSSATSGGLFVNGDGKTIASASIDANTFAYGQFNLSGSSYNINMSGFTLTFWATKPQNKTYVNFRFEIESFLKFNNNTLMISGSSYTANLTNYYDITSSNDILTNTSNWYYTTGTTADSGQFKLFVNNVWNSLQLDINYVDNGSVNFKPVMDLNNIYVRVEELLNPNNYCVYKIWLKSYFTDFARYSVQVVDSGGTAVNANEYTISFYSRHSKETEYFIALSLDNKYIRNSSNVLNFYAISPNGNCIYDEIETGGILGNMSIEQDDFILINASANTTSTPIFYPYASGMTTSDIRFYSRHLSMNEISAIYNNGFGTSQQTYNNYPTLRSPMYWYKMQAKTHRPTTGFYRESCSGMYGGTLTKHSQFENSVIIDNIDSSNSINMPLVENVATFYHLLKYTGTTFSGICYGNYSVNNSIFGLSGYTTWTISFWMGYPVTSSFAGTGKTYILRSYNDKFKISLYFADTNVPPTIYLMIENTGSTQYSTYSTELSNVHGTEFSWSHYCIVYNDYYTNRIGTPFKSNLYINGVIQNVNNIMSQTVNDTGLKIGGHIISVDPGFEPPRVTEYEGPEIGLFDMRIFNYALTENEIEQLWNNNKVGMY